VFVFLVVDLFDNVGTLMAVAKKAGLIEAGGRIPRVTSILLADATATLAGSLAGTTTVTSYIESAAGVAMGGKTGVTSIAEISWDDVCVAFPAFLTLITIPLTFSIANGLACGIISYVVIHGSRGRGREAPQAAYAMALLLIVRIVYMGSRT